jgi:hypothetical protein
MYNTGKIAMRINMGIEVIIATTTNPIVIRNIENTDLLQSFVKHPPTWELLV